MVKKQNGNDEEHNGNVEIKKKIKKKYFSSY